MTRGEVAPGKFPAGRMRGRRARPFRLSSADPTAASTRDGGQQPPCRRRSRGVPMASFRYFPVLGGHARRAPLLAGLGAAALLAAACGSSGSGTSGGSTGAGGYGAPPASSAPAAAAQAAAISAHATSLGDVLVGPSGNSVYLFEKDVGTTSSCSGACAAAWPPVTTSGAPIASGAVHASKLGTTQRSDGTTQVTYAGHPLYYFVGDRSASDVRGEGLKNFGAGWYVLAPTGQKIDKD